VAGRQTSSFTNDVHAAAPLQVRINKAGAVSVAALPERFYNDTDKPLTLSKVSLGAGTAPTGAALTADVKISGTTVFAASGDRVKIAAGANYGEAVPTKTGDAVVVKPGQYVTVEVTVVGSTVAGSDLTAQLSLV